MTDLPTDAPLASPASAGPAAYPDLPQASGPPSPPGPSCPTCGTDNDAGATFCEACGADIAPAGPAASGATTGAPTSGLAVGVGAVATPQTAPTGEESPLDVGWTGVVTATGAGSALPDLTCAACGLGQIVDGYCDHCGTPPPDPRNHVVQTPATWVGGVCDIGKRHSRNEDAMSLSASPTPGSRAVLVVCDGVSMATDSHIASLAAAKAALVVLDQPFPRGVGTHDAWTAGAGRALTTAVSEADAAVAATVTADVPNPPSCTFAAAVVENEVIVAANVGDSRVYWLPDSAAEPARQLGSDDSYAQEQIDGGMDREQAETGPQAHSITRWLGKDSPDDLTPHLTTVVATPGWLMVCSDGLWNYCSEADELRARVQSAATVAARPDGTSDPTEIAQQLVDFANAQGGRDNITVAVARLAGQGSIATSGVAFATAPAASEEEETTHG
ncbi:serine/threonine protein phosphatase [Humibacillus sp. DSM 29435]|uniref:PP2C family protein-serine/threonine phosphatase n=1 Tax=Humibacillus sp. DSM 29435 TaxID=1869167 RepID=UPI0008733EFA|nr:PP2C family serine/threonine-protein phosphatase [Humibacillus sp. DSM 29435]OFE18812.1 serine/threonine protein phosphatase [Humibacillus sp. DSM 29435]